MRIGSLFSGIGGLELGLEWSGVGRTAWQVEREEYARQVLARHWPDATRYSDVFDVGAHNLAPVDVICGGFPCQPVSVAGKRQAGADDRWLWPEMARIIEEMGPRYVVAENVPGLLSADGDPLFDSYTGARAMREHHGGLARQPVSGGAFASVLCDLDALGYDAQWHVFGAVDVGAPHRRNRVFIAAVRRQPAANADDYRRGRRQGTDRGDISDFNRDLPAQTRGRQNGARGTRVNGQAGYAAKADSARPQTRGRHATASMHRRDKGTKPRYCPRSAASQWAPGPTVSPVCRVDDGATDGLDISEWRQRLMALGNAVVPQCAALVGSYIVELEAGNV